MKQYPFTLLYLSKLNNFYSQTIMITKTKLFIFLFCLFNELCEFVHCETEYLYSQVDAGIILSQKQVRSGNLRLHETIKASQTNETDTILGLIVGPLMFLISFAFIWFNEKRAAIQYRRLKLAEQICVQVHSFCKDQIASANMKLTHVTGMTTTGEVVRDEVAEVMVDGAIKLVRKVEVMEWRARTKVRNGEKKVQYNLDWQSENIPNAEGRLNPPSTWFIQPETLYNYSVTLGEYFLSRAQMDQCKQSRLITLNMQNANTIATNMQLDVTPIVEGGWVYFPSPENGLVNGHGAVRISYAYCPVGEITLMARSVDTSFEPFPIARYECNDVIERNPISNCCRCCTWVAQLFQPIEQINFVQQSILNKSELIKLSLNRLTLDIRINRIITYVMMVVGIVLFFSYMTDVLGYIPILGGLLRSTVLVVVVVAALVVCVPLWIITFSLAWLWYHPKVGVIFFGAGVTILGTILLINHINQAEDEQTSQTTVSFAAQRLLQTLLGSM